MSTDEQETIINFSRNEDRAYIFTSDTMVMTKLDKFVNEGAYTLDRVEKEPDGTVCGKWYSCPKRVISFRKRPMSDERRAAMSVAAVEANIVARL